MPRKPDLPCADCGSLMSRTKGNLPEGEARCAACRGRVIYGSGPGHGTQRRYKLGCRCGPCATGNNRSARMYRLTVIARTGFSPRSKGAPKDCAVCGEPLKLAHPSAVWHAECRPVKFYARPERRLAVYERDGWICQLCSKPVDPALSHRDAFSATLDHIVPRSLGGTNGSENLRLAHLVCNSIRGNRVDAA